MGRATLLARTAHAAVLVLTFSEFKTLSPALALSPISKAAWLSQNSGYYVGGGREEEQRQLSSPHHHTFRRRGC